MEKKVFQPKVLLLIVLLALIPGIVFAINTISEGYRLNANTYEEIPASGSSCRIVENKDSNDYFVPTNTTAEWDAFIANKPSDVILHSCCKTGAVGGVEGIYTGAQYYKDANCGHTPPCYLAPPIGGSAVVSESTTGGSCGIFNKWRTIQCSTLYKPLSICHGDPCVTGMQWQSDKNKVKICYGSYDAVLNTCIYEGSETLTIDGTGYASYIVGDEFNINYVGVGSFGTCSTSLPCGDGRCSSQYGESCSSCPADCGACVYVCSDYNYEYACTGAGCYWHSYGFTCSDTPCSEYYYESACTADGCYWDSYNYICSSSGDDCSSYYDQYTCEDAGCYWDNWACIGEQEYE